MKKLVAVLLAAAMILGCAACTSEETTKKKKKTKKTTEKTEETDDPTEDPTDDTTEDPTDDTTTEPSDTTSDTMVQVDTSDSASDTTKTPSAPSELIIHNDLESLGAMTGGHCLTYGAMDPTGEKVLPGDCPVGLYFYWESLTTTNGSNTLNDELDLLFEEMTESTQENYEEYLEDFLEDIADGDSPTTCTLYEKNEVYRADSQVFSFRLNASIYADNIDTNDSSFYVNVDPATLDDIELDHLITDMDAFKTYVTTYFGEIGEDYKLDEVMEGLDAGEMNFGLLYDGVMFDDIKVPVAGHEELFNMEYFGATPKNYSLYLDGKGELVWDLDKDGSLDTLKCEYVGSELIITVNGQEYTITGAEAPNIDYMEDLAFNSPCVVMCSEDFCYLIVSLNETDSVVGLYFFDLSAGKPEYAMDRYGRLRDVLDPMYFSIAEDVDLLGGLVMDRYYQLKSDDSLIPQTAFVYCMSHPYLTYTDISGDEFNWDNGNVIGSYTIKAGSVVQVIAYGPNNGALVLKVLNPDNTDVHYVNLETDKESKIAGVSVEDLFHSQLYIGG